MYMYMDNFCNKRAKRIKIIILKTILYVFIRFEFIIFISDRVWKKLNSKIDGFDLWIPKFTKPQEVFYTLHFLLRFKNVDLTSLLFTSFTLMI